MKSLIKKVARKPFNIVQNYKIKKQVKRDEAFEQLRLREERQKLKLAYRTATDLGLFNLEWYEAHCGKFASGLEGFEDYLSKSLFSNVNPSANFDTESYLRNHLDIYYAGISPLLHYIYHGRKEGRRVYPANLRWNPNDELLPIESEGWNTQKIAICLHIFYPDFVEKFAECLKNFPCQVDVFVACPSQEIAADVQNSYGAIENVRCLNVAVAPNRGRNFGPLLVEFGKELLNYDLMCHLHSKKSLYSGREQTQWFDYLNQYLFKDKHVVSCVLRLFSEDKSLGVYYPTSFWMMPAWVNNWTCNKPFAQSFVKEWQLDITDDFVNYPVGGMFWARPKALEQLLTTSFSYEDFPEEPLPNDGSWLHALERVIGLLAEKNDYKQFYYYPPAARFTNDKSYVFANYHKTPPQLFNELSQYDVVSFDIFDTVLRRKFCEPEYAKWKVGEFLTQNGLMPSAESFVKLRNDAEHQLRIDRKFVGDVSIVDVYKRLADVLVCDVEQTMSFMDLEFQNDFEQVLAKDEMVNLVHQLSDADREIWFVSDIYYTQSQVEMMLRKIGIAVPFKLFVSSEMNKRKDTGVMWEFIKDKVNTEQVRYIHVGDNVRSDAQLCGDYGLSNMHVLHPYDKWRASGFINPTDVINVRDEKSILKWGQLISNIGRYPFFGE